MFVIGVKGLDLYRFVNMKTSSLVEIIYTHMSCL